MSFIALSTPLDSIHGGADAQGRAAFDFSTNANSAGPCPHVWQAVLQADRASYPDPQYAQLRQMLADFHGVNTEQIVVGTSGSELIFRVSYWASCSGFPYVRIPLHAYGDYDRAARQYGLLRQAQMDVSAEPVLIWHAAPSSPLGCWDAMPEPRIQDRCVVDMAYWPMRLDHRVSSLTELPRSAWQLWSPNKAVGMTGVRAAYLIVPAHDVEMAQVLRSLAPSWCVGADGVAMLNAWVQPAAQVWLVNSLMLLRDRMQALCELLTSHQWTLHPSVSVSSFLCAQPASPLTQADVQALRSHGIKLRDTTSFGLPSWWRLSAQPQSAHDALNFVLHELRQMRQRKT